jgi:flagellar biosynthesis/type III secretory pathway M-ring protein FliF/YscJ
MKRLALALGLVAVGVAVGAACGGLGALLLHGLSQREMRYSGATEIGTLLLVLVVLLLLSRLKVRQPGRPATTAAPATPSPSPLPVPTEKPALGRPARGPTPQQPPDAATPGIPGTTRAELPPSPGLEPLPPRQQEVAKARVTRLAQSQPEDVLRILQSWLREE